MTTCALLAAVLMAQAAAPRAAAPQAAQPAAPAQQGAALNLDEALREAIARNPDLKVLAERVRQSSELSWKAWSAYLPRVTAGGTYTHTNIPDVAFPVQVGPTEFTTVVIQKQDQLAAQAEANQALIAPEAVFGIKSAKAATRAAQAQLEFNRRDLLFGVAQVFYAAAGAKQAVTVAERLLALNLDREKDARVRYEAGTTPRVALLRAQIDRASAEQDLKRAQNAYASTRVALAALLDRNDTDFDVVVPPPPPAQDPRALEARLLEQRLDVQAAREQISVAEQSRNGVIARYAPSLGAFARWQWANLAGFAGKYSTWAVGLGLSWTLLDGGLRESDLRDAESRMAEAEAALRGTELRATDDLRRAALDVDSAVANREKSKERVELARETYKLVDVNYRAGAGTYLEVSDASVQLSAAEIQLISDSINADLAAIRLLKAAGLWR